MTIENGSPGSSVGVTASCWSPVWSPDGQQIAFLSERDGLTGIYVMNADGSDAHRLTSTLSVGRGYSWSPDSRQIAFSALDKGNADVYVVDTARQIIVALTRDPAPDESPAWRP